jgi:hypothetical protein
VIAGGNIAAALRWQRCTISMFCRVPNGQRALGRETRAPHAPPCAPMRDEYLLRILVASLAYGGAGS